MIPSSTQHALCPSWQRWVLAEHCAHLAPTGDQPEPSVLSALESLLFAPWLDGTWACGTCTCSCPWVQCKNHPYCLMQILLSVCWQRPNMEAQGQQIPPAEPLLPEPRIPLHCAQAPRAWVALTQASQHDPNGAEVGKSTECKGGNVLGSLLESTVAGFGHLCSGAAPEHPEVSTMS